MGSDEGKSIKERKDNFSKLMLASDVTTKRSLKKIQDQANTIAHLEADIGVLNKAIIVVTKFEIYQAEHMHN